MQHRLWTWRLLPLLAGVGFAVAAPAEAECKKDGSPGPSVALVLSGGGALAASQIGAIKALEEAHIPIHCIIGNSMGAIVGALYMAGQDADGDGDHDADDLKKIFIDYEDWNRNSFGANVYKDLGFRSKEEQHDFFAGAVVGIDGGTITLPPGLSSLRGMRSYLRENLKTLPREGSFDNLPITFRAVATELRTGQLTVFGEGDVVDVVLASMAVPGLYPAQRINNEWYVDGGMSNQLPVDVAKCLNKATARETGRTAARKLEKELSDQARKLAEDKNASEEAKRQANEAAVNATLAAVKDTPIVVDASCIGADIVIAIDTTLDPMINSPITPDKPPSFADTAMQLVNLKVYENWKSQPGNIGGKGVLIHPDITGMSTFDFSQKSLSELYRRGYEAAQKKVVQDELTKIRVFGKPAPAPVAKSNESIRIADVIVDHASGIEEKVITDRLGIRPGDHVTPEQIDRRMTDVNALGVFDDVDYQLIRADGAGDPVLHVDTSPSPLGRNLLQLGARLSTSLDGEATYQLLARYTRTPMNSYGGRLSATLGLGTDNVLDLDYVHPLGGAARTFAELSLGLASRRVPIAIGDEQLAERIDKTAEINAALGYEFGQWGAATVGVFATALQSDVKVGTDPSVGAQDGNYTGFTGRFAVDRFNSPSFPTSGFMGDLHVSQYYVATDGGGGTDGLRSEVSVAAASKIDPVGLFLRFDGGNIDQRTEGLPTFKLGGFKRLSGFLDNSLPATRYGLWRMEAFSKLADDSAVPIYVGGTFEIASFDLSFLGPDAGDDVTAGSLYGAIDTVLGPAYLAYGMGEGGRRALYFYFGRAF